MTKSPDNPRRTLSHFKRLSREGKALLSDRPLDELAHAKWFERTRRYLEQKMPEVQILPPDQLISVKMPNPLSPTYRQPHQLDAAIHRCDQGRKLTQQMLAIVASATERIELRLETDNK